MLKSYTIGEIVDILNGADSTLHLRDKTILGDVTMGEVLDALKEDPQASAAVVNRQITLGEVVDFLKGNVALKAMRDKSISMKTTVGDIMELFGEENVREFIQQKTAAAAYKPEYISDVFNIAQNWLMLCVFIFFFAMIATIALELIDKDKR